MTDGNRNAQRVLPERFSNNGVTDIGSMSWFNLGGHLSKSLFTIYRKSDIFHG